MRDEIYQMLSMSLLRPSTEEDLDESVKELVDITLKLLDKDDDNKISFDDYKRAVLEDNLLLECLGPCLPSRKTLQIFIEKIMNSKE